MFAKIEELAAPLGTVIHKGRSSRVFNVEVGDESPISRQTLGILPPAWLDLLHRGACPRYFGGLCQRWPVERTSVDGSRGHGHCIFARAGQVGLSWAALGGRKAFPRPPISDV